MLKTLKLCLLGMPQISLDEESLTEKLTIREQALLYYLAVNGQLRNRSVVAALLWGDVTDQQALKACEMYCRICASDFGGHLTIDYHTLGFNHQSLYWLDVTLSRYLGRS